MLHVPPPVFSKVNGSSRGKSNMLPNVSVTIHCVVSPINPLKSTKIESNIASSTFIVSIKLPSSKVKLPPATAFLFTVNGLDKSNVPVRFMIVSPTVKFPGIVSYPTLNNKHCPTPAKLKSNGAAVGRSIISPMISVKIHWLKVALVSANITNRESTFPKLKHISTVVFPFKSVSVPPFNPSLVTVIAFDKAKHPMTCDTLLPTCNPVMALV